MGFIPEHKVSVHIKKNVKMLKYGFRNKNGDWDHMFISIPKGHLLVSEKEEEIQRSLLQEEK